MKTGMRQPEVLMNGGAVGNATANEIAAMSADIQAWANKEHNDDGGHLDITARSIQVAGAAVVGSDGTFGGNVIAQSGGAGEAQMGVLSNIPSEPVEYGLLLGGTAQGFEWYVRPAAAPALGGQELRLYDLSHTLASVLRIVWDPISGSHIIGPETGGQLTLGQAAYSTAIKAVNAKTVNAFDGYKEHGRSVASGDWAAVTYAGSNFTASGATLTVEAADVVEHKVSYNGYTLRMKVFVQGASTSGAGATELDIAIPGGFTAKGRNPGAMWLNLNGTYEWGTYQTSDGGSVIKIFRQDPSATFGAYTNTLGFRGEIEIEINA